MPDLVYGSGAVEQARTAVAAEARRVPALADALVVPAGAAAGTATAGLDDALLDALARLRGALVADLTAAGRRLDALERALDATQRSMEATDHDAAASWRRAGPPASGA
jgi:hypothetical protein